MACIDDDTLLRYLARDLADDPTPVEAHLDRCPTCRRVVAGLAHTSLLAHARPTADAIPAWQSDFLPAGVRIGRYVLEGRIGSGSMGVVYRARDPQLRRAVAIKQLRTSVAADAEHRARLQREARSLARLSHPNVVPIYDVGVHDGYVFLAMELVPGVTLRDWLARARRAPAAILAAFRSAGEGLVAAHAAGLVHRDFKPENVLVGDDGRILVTDFGLVALTAGDPEESLLDTPPWRDPPTASATGGCIGTPAYMAPEQLAGETVGPAADQFAFCVALFEALTGRRPFKGRGPSSLLRAIGAAEIDPLLATLPRRQREVLRRGLHPHAWSRYASMADLLEALRPRPRRWWWMAGLGIGLVAPAVAAVGTPAPHTDTVSSSAPVAATDAPSPAIPLLARAAAERDDNLPTALRTLQAAHEVASAAGDWPSAADAAIELVRLHGLDGTDTDTAFDWQRHAEAALLRHGPGPERDRRHADLLDAMGSVHVARSEFELARDRLREAITAYAALFGDADPRVAGARSNLGLALARLGDVEAAHAEHARALAVDLEPGRRAPALARLAATYAHAGDHARARPRYEEAIALADAADLPMLVGKVSSNLADSLVQLGDLPAAAASLDRAEVALTRVFSAEHISVAAVLNGKATVQLVAGNYAAGQELMERSLALRERTLGLDHPQLAPMIGNLAQIAAHLGDHATARRHTERAVAILEHAYGEHDLRVAPDVEILANMLATGGEPETALRRAEQAYAARRQRVGEDDPSLSRNWLVRGKVFIETERWREADHALDRAETLAATGAEKTAVQLTRAEALWRRGRRPAAVREAKRARTTLADDPLQAPLRAAIDDWFATHGRRAKAASPR